MFHINIKVLVLSDQQLWNYSDRQQGEQNNLFVFAIILVLKNVR